MVKPLSSAKIIQHSVLSTYFSKACWSVRHQVLNITMKGEQSLDVSKA